MTRITSRLMRFSSVLLLSGTASAAPATFTFVSSETFDAGFPSTQTFTPSLPFSGTGDVDEAAGTYSLSLPAFTIVLDILASAGGDDASLLTTGWSQTGTFAGGAGGAMTSSSAGGTTTCTNLGGIGGLVCADFPAPVDTWPPTGAGGPTLGAPSATIDLADGAGFDGTITVNNRYDASGGQVQTIYRYSLAPEPGQAVMLAMGILVLFLVGRRGWRAGPLPRALGDSGPPTS